ncbi:SusC/RagA family TonB-linked outer membrane protein [Pedobacter steynii]|uniref:SusC/RagA family protein n=1 Tax=Pedobacter steynii TaxID=430522 RepID=A0A1D7QGH5_9SPHI|nr:SusC/RagA family TonB-linked outer membrane protein [Pedobacter steynii]AOM77745.1 SusC/RagA family protein [Pedobacter steynii]
MEKNYQRKLRRLKYGLSALLFFTFFCFSFAKADELQYGAIKTERLENYLRTIENAYKISFVYDAAQINKEMSIDVPVKLISIRTDLEPLKSRGINYSIVGKQVILKKAPVVAVNKDIVVKGIVRSKSANGQTETLPGASVREKGASNGVSTNSNGEFQIKVKDDAVLVFTAIGYKSQEITVAGKTAINVVLEEDISQLKEVTISTGYQNLNKKLFTGAATKLKAVDVERSGIQDVSRMLEGQVAGVSVQNVSGTFGAAPKIRVRGATSISGDNKPLWVVDGIILEDIVNISNEQLSTGDPSTLIGSSVAGLNPDDIESFEILRDASATAMYGARAMNGVVVVTTKKGKNTEGQPVISYSGNFTTFLKPTYSQFDIMNSADQMQVYLDMQGKGWLNHADVSSASNGGVFRKMYDQLYVYNPITKTYALRNDEASRTQFLNRYANANTDWFDLLFRNSLMQDHSLSIIAGSAKSKIYASTSFLNDSGWTVGDGVKRFTGTIRGNFDINDRLQIELSTQGNVRDQRSPGTVNRDNDAVSGRLNRDFDINPFKYALNTSRVLTAFNEDGSKEYFTQNYAPFNILNELENNSIKTSIVDLKVQAGLKYKILEGLKYSFDGAYRFVKSDREHSITEYSNTAQAYRAYGNQNVIENNRFLYRDPSKPGSLPQIVLPEGGFYNVTSNNLVNYYMRHSVEYDKVFNEDHLFNAFGSAELRYIDKQSRFNNGVGYQFDRGGVPFLTPDYFKQNIEANSFYYGMGTEYERYLSYMARAAYSYKGKYSINATGRYDGSNLLGESPVARWLPTWNVSGAWNMHEEDFFKKQNILSRATIRATYGLTASTANAKNSTIIFRNQTTRRPDNIDKESSIYIDGLENSELTWEKQYETNLGFDLGFFKERFSLSVDLYKRNGYDLIGRIPTSGIGGEGFKLANYADMKSKGIELTLNAKVIDHQKFKWSTNLNFGFHKGEITSLENEPTIFNLITEDGGARVGYPQRGLFSIVFDGLDHSTGVPTFINEKGERQSQSVYFQSNNLAHLKYEGQIDPKLTGGYSNRFSYGGFSLSALVTFSAGNKVRLSPNYSNRYTDLSATSNDFLGRWTMPGDELKTRIPSIADRYVEANLPVGAYPYNTYNYSTERVADGGFVRLKQVMLTYQVPKDWAKRIGASNASVGLVGNNVWLIYSDKRLNGQDPEFFGAGGVAMPIPHQYSLSLKLGF